MNDKDMARTYASLKQMALEHPVEVLIPKAATQTGSLLADDIVLPLYRDDRAPQGVIQIQVLKGRKPGEGKP